MAETAPPLPFTGPISTKRVSDVIAERLAKAIQDGALQPGDRLPTEQQLASEFGVGRTSVREGLQKLRALGLIETRKGLGAFVSDSQAGDPLAEFARWTSHDPASIVELLEARVALETLAAGLAAVRASDDELAELLRLATTHVPAGDPPDVDSMVEWDTAFHLKILAASRNVFVARLYDALIGELNDFRRRTLALPWAAARSAQDHALIAEAISHRDAAAARRTMSDHLWVIYSEIVKTAAADGTAKMLPAPREALS